MVRWTLNNVSKRRISSSSRQLTQLSRHENTEEQLSREEMILKLHQVIANFLAWKFNLLCWFLIFLKCVNESCVLIIFTLDFTIIWMNAIIVYLMLAKRKVRATVLVIYYSRAMVLTLDKRICVSIWFQVVLICFQFFQWIEN